MSLVELVVGLLLCSVALSWLARKSRVPYAVALVAGGTALSFIPELPKLTLDPDLVLTVFLPPVLYLAALQTSWRDFKRWSPTISMLAIGLVVATTVAIGCVAHWMIPGLPWAAAFALGAIISPPDAVAATAILNPLHMPRRLVTVLEGESLVNDASGLVLYKFAVVAVVTGAFDWHGKGLEFIWVGGAGVAIGMLFGRGYVEIQRRLGDALVEVLLALTLPYSAYLVAEHFDVSGVLAVVAAGLVRARYMAEVSSPETRLLGRSVWNVIVFLVNSLIFIMIGLELPGVLEGLTQYVSSTRLAMYAIAILLTAVAVRMFWVFPLAYVSRPLLRLFGRRDPAPPWQETLISGWCGMRGIVSMAAALALPHHLDSGAAFPERHLLIFLTFATILGTLVLQGLTLAPLIRLLNIKQDSGPEEEARRARVQMLHAGLAEINRRAAAGDLPEGALEPLRGLYTSRLTQLEGNHDSPGGGLLGLNALRTAVLQAERRQLIKMWREGTIAEEARWGLERDLDLEESRLATEE